MTGFSSVNRDFHKWDSCVARWHLALKNTHNGSAFADVKRGKGGSSAQAFMFADFTRCEPQPWNSCSSIQVVKHSRFDLRTCKSGLNQLLS